MKVNYFKFAIFLILGVVLGLITAILFITLANQKDIKDVKQALSDIKYDTQYSKDKLMDAEFEIIP